MNLNKLNPWNWFKHEEDGERRNLPIRRQSDPHLVTTSPWLSLHQEIDRMFDNVFRNFGMPSLGIGTSGSALEGGLFKPNVDIDASDKEYRITMELPGVEEQDIDVELSRDGVLSVRGEKKHEREEKNRDVYRIERSYGSFERILALPDDVNQNNINARFKTAF